MLISSCGSIYKNEIKNEVTNKIEEVTTSVGTIQIDSLEQAVKTVYQKVSDAVIGITLKKVVTKKVGLKEATYEDKLSIGSGVIYKCIPQTLNGEIVNYEYYCYTNAHVLTPEEEVDTTVYAYLGKYNEEIKATIVGKDDVMDIACIKFMTCHKIIPVELGDANSLSIGNFCVVIGNPDGYEYYGSITFGVVSNLGRTLSFDTDGDGINDYSGQFIQTDAAINPGNSGGGMFTLDGKLVGIPSVKLTSTKIDNMGFAIPVNLIRTACDDYFEQGKEIVRARLGITCIAVRDMSSDRLVEESIISFPNIFDGKQPYGVYITEVAAFGTLANTLVEAKDILLSIDGNLLYSNSDIAVLLNDFTKYTIGKEVEIVFYDASKNSVETIKVLLKTGR